MRMKSVQQRLANSVWHILAACAFLAVVSAAVGQDLPQPRNHVEDRANVIQPNVERQLIAVLADLERKTGAQIIVVTVETTGGVSIEDYALNLAERWKLGQKDKENGALVVVAVKDRDYRFEIGYGLEGVLPDSFVGSVGRNYFVPYFRQGDYSSGIYQGVLAMVQQVARDANVSISGAAAPVAPKAPRATGQRGYRRGSRRGLWGSCGVVPFIVIIIIFSVLRSRAGYHRRWGGFGGGSWLTWMLLGSMLGGGRRRYGGWGGGGFGGGGFGGGFGGGSFGGGGGGGFGGGGASGSW